MPSAVARAAANSIASGIPSSRRQIAAIPTMTAWSGANLEFAPLTLSRNSRTEPHLGRSFPSSAPSVGTGSGDTGKIHSPSALSGSRLVAITCMAGLARNKASAIVAAASITCSQLSSTSKSCFPDSALATRSAETAPAPGVTLAASATVAATRSASATGASSTNQTPSGNSSPARARPPRRVASCRCRRGRSG